MTADGWICYEELFHNTPANEPLLMTLEYWDDFAGYIAAEANHCESRKKQAKLDGIFEKIQKLLVRFSDEEPPQIIKLSQNR